MEKIDITTIEPNDNPGLAEIIRSALAEFGANKPGTVYYDPTTDALFELFKRLAVSIMLPKKRARSSVAQAFFHPMDCRKGCVNW